ncbi:MAG: ATP-binding protein, partial [Erysipelotrichaceae bacterium]|nr:ATP-binding protein [Erysipelotrichaceae bacterium]
MYFEDNKTELKRELTDDVKREMIAFLNTHGGVIYIGVNDDGTIHEPFISHNRDEIFKKLSSWIQDDFYPLPSTLVRFDFNDDGVLAIEVSEGNNKPYYLRDKGPIPSGVYRRSGTSVRKCSEDEILRMIMNSSHYVFESDISEDQDLTFGYFKRICDERQINTDDKLFLSLGLINSEGKYTNLGLL